MSMHTDTEIIDRLGGTTEVARICMIKPPSVSEWRVSGIPPARRQFLQLLRPEAFGLGESTTSSIGARVDTRMSKRALRARLGLSTDKQLATVLQLPAEVVEGWEEERALPAVPEVLRLLGVQPEAQAAQVPADPDDDRIVPVESA